MSNTRRIRGFSGMIPRTSYRELPNEAAILAIDCDFRHGDLRPYPGYGPSVHRCLEGPGCVRTINYIRDTCAADGCGTWICEEDQVTIVANPTDASLSEESQLCDRHYVFGGTGPPQVRLCDDGGEVVLFDLGVPAPTEQPTVATTGIDNAGYGKTFEVWCEDENGNRTNTQALNVTEVTPDVTYTATTNLDCGTGTLHVGMTATDNNTNESLGFVADNASSEAVNNNFVYQGNNVGLAVVNANGNLTITIEYTENPLFTYTRSRSYIYTFVNRCGEEGARSPISDIINVTPADAVVVSNIQVPTDITLFPTKRIYRTVSGTDGATQFQFVADIPATQVTYTDELTDDQTGDPYLFDGNVPPPDGLKGGLVSPGNFLVAFVGNQLYFSQIGLFHAWPNFLGVPFEIVSVEGPFENSFLVTTTEDTYLVYGDDPTAMRYIKVSADQPGLNQFGTADIGRFGIIYVSYEGIVLVRAGSASLITDQFYKPEQWRELNPSTMQVAWHNGQIICYNENVTLMFDMEEGIRWHWLSSLRLAAHYKDRISGRLYVLDATDGFIKEWGTGELLTAIWIGGFSFENRPFEYSHYRIEQQSSAAELRIYRSDTRSLDVDGNAIDLGPVLTIQPEDSDYHSLPVLPRSQCFAPGIVTNGVVSELLLTNNPLELAPAA